MSETESSAAVEVVKPDAPVVNPYPAPGDQATEKAAEDEKKSAEEGVETSKCIAILHCLMSHHCLSLCS